MSNITDRDRLIELIQKEVKRPKADALADYLLANGVIVPPCKVGQTVYCLIQGFENPLKATVNRITVQVSGIVISCSVLGYFGQSYIATDFGKTVFITKEEAEQTLGTDKNVGSKKEREGK